MAYELGDIYINDIGTWRVTKVHGASWSSELLTPSEGYLAKLKSTPTLERPEDRNSKLIKLLRVKGLLSSAEEVDLLR